MIQAQKLEIVETPGKLADDGGYIPEINLPNENLETHSKSPTQTNASPQKRKRGRPKKNRAGGRKKRIVEEPNSLNDVPDLSHDSEKQVKPAVPLTLNSNVLPKNVTKPSRKFRSNSQHSEAEEISFLDVLRHFVENFQADALYSDEFKLHVLSTIDELRDKAEKLNTTANTISKIQNEKDLIRQKILVVKEQTRQVATEMSECMGIERKKKLEYYWTKSIHDQVETLKREIQNELETSSLDTVAEQLPILKALLNPETGIVSKLTIINEKLKQKEAEFPAL